MSVKLSAQGLGRNEHLISGHFAYLSDQWTSLGAAVSQARDWGHGSDCNPWPAGALVPVKGENHET